MPDVKLSERALKVAAFAAIYFVWGSTYIAIRLVADTLPAFIMIGLRFFLAGLILYAYAIMRRLPNPSLKQWGNASLSGIILLCFGTGGVVWGVQYLDSGLVALLVGTEPLFLALLMWAWPGGRRPSLGTFGALALGFCGAALLAAPSPDGAVRLGPSLVVLAATVAWGIGCLYSRDAELPSSPLLVTSIQMLAAGVVMTAFGFGIGEWRAFDPQAVSATSVLAFAYLVVFGSIIAFSAFSWLIRNTEPTLVVTHTYVNPVVAVFLGWLIAGEPVGPRIMVASALIVGSVFLITTASIRQARKSTPAPLRQPAPALATAGVAARRPSGRGRVACELERCA